MIVDRFTREVLDVDEAKAASLADSGDNFSGWIVDLIFDLPIARLTYRDQRRRESINIWTLPAVCGE